MGSYVYVADSNLVTKAAVTVATTATTLGVDGTQLPKNVIRVMAPTSNTASIFLGDSTVTTSTGLELAPGAYMDFYTRNVSKLFGIVASGTQNLRVAVM